MPFWLRQRLRFLWRARLRECFVQNYVDHDPGQTFHDYRCGPLAYDAHRGTDFRVKDLLTLERGCLCWRRRQGRVARVRDGFPDRSVDDLVAREIAEDGGNLVILEHEDGWTTLYAHLRAGSIAVLPGQRLEKGQHLGLMGLSGRTRFPHVHGAA
jgi:hypothetical protein